MQDVFAWAPDWLTAKPQIIDADSPELTGWGPMGEIAPRGGSAPGSGGRRVLGTMLGVTQLSLLLTCRGGALS